MLFQIALDQSMYVFFDQRSLTSTTLENSVIVGLENFTELKWYRHFNQRNRLHRFVTVQGGGNW